MRIASPTHYLGIEKNVVENIKKTGLSVNSIMSDGVTPSFTYTTGMKLIDCPDIIVFGVPAHHATTVLNAVHEHIKENGSLEPYKMYDCFIQDHNVCFLPVHNKFKNDYFYLTEWYYQEHGFDALQLVWPDKNGAFPWQLGYDSKMDIAQTLICDIQAGKVGQS